jgi:hypothetical protein
MPNYFFFFCGAGVRSMTRSASSNLTPLRFSFMSFGGVFLTGCFLFTVSFPAQTVMDYSGFYKTILLPGQPRYSNGLAVG